MAMQETMSAWFCTMNSWLSTGGFLLLFLRIPMAGTAEGGHRSPARALCGGAQEEEEARATAPPLQQPQPPPSLEASAPRFTSPRPKEEAQSHCHSRPGADSDTCRPRGPIGGSRDVKRFAFSTAGAQ